MLLLTELVVFCGPFRLAYEGQLFRRQDCKRLFGTIPAIKSLLGQGGRHLGSALSFLEDSYENFG
jgi:hypothetical protein